MERITRKEQKERTRANLVDEALHLFSTKGISSTTTADVAKALDVSHGTVFVHFPTREELILAAVERFGERLSVRLNAKLTSDLHLKEILQAHLSVLTEFEDFYLRVICESQTLPPQIRSLVYSMNAAISYRLFHAAQKQMKDGSIKRIPQASLFNSWMALLNYHIMNRDLLSEKSPILKHKGDEILRLFLMLIKTREDK
ncbi:MAG TPA: TetR/AcrR family transcriptional regulator [Pseudobdellovibrionaceae bacterium]|jgi:AcrR family transcriptional regulator